MSKQIAAGPLLIFGANGQVGRALFEILKIRYPQQGVHLMKRAEADFSRPESLRGLVSSHKPSVVINAAAYTKVDLAETEEKLASTVNGESPRVLAEECQKFKIPFIHFSTDYVFSDKAGSSRPWKEDDPVNPINAYGRSKVLGEKGIKEAGGHWMVFRTSWAYDSSGQNFVNTMLKLGRTREKISVVNDQFGAPTYACHLAEATLAALDKALQRSEAFPSGIYHACGGGETTWFGFAEKVFENARKLGIDLKVKEVVPVSTAEYPTPAKRPSNSRLDTSKLRQVFGISLPHWNEGLKACFERLKS